MNSAKSESLRVVKKYGSRRLYDTVTSKYISFKELGEIIADGFEVSVIDSKTNEDLTRITLASYLVENTHVLNFCSNELLALIIKNQSYSNETKSVIKNIIDQSLAYWIPQGSKK
ncbi:polyhydroxyalkanoate synthesis regulator DNA-binding domain-containing protein [Polynucleobacter sp. Adler-ghost]|uniref:polyhydroxyalkanoate synthesis regulator DNA-binding domain-containing protein n=1 Tax=Polynucleobacter sp. Adler-ghost TaxID=2770234 RepID=UPI001BFEAACC|nr:polyhydroxyalkanoate synthesis regulator DNA-binding domain-containing protein [Polynucleobacter sp. Adler-ghost]QWE29902.1 hypothetical protein ICV89_06240 [Polynucleobacter sp. Adler-ghost]